MPFTIRPIKSGEDHRVVEMAKALLMHLGDGIENFDEERYRDDAFGDDPQFKLLVAVTSDEELIGYTAFHDAYEPSYAARGVYIIDLFVDEAMRGQGVGTALIRAVARDAHARGRTFIWLVTTSDAARAYYDNIMNLKVNVTAYALTGDNFVDQLSLKPGT